MDMPAALALVQMSTPTRPVNHKTRNSQDSDVLSTNTTPSGSPVHCFKLSHVKRTREDLVTVVYSSGLESMEIPFARGEESTVFYERREKAARLLFDANRKDAYCTWRKELVNINVTNPAWTLFKDSLHQKRYSYGCIQLVVARYTCRQWKEEGSACRHCQNRTWRVGCMTPSYLYYIMPMMQNTLSLVESDLSMFEPLEVQRDATAWEKRVPTMACR